MDIALRGSSPGATTAGILLLTRARQLGLPLTVSVVGDPSDAVEIPGPAVCYAPVLASCEVGRDHGYGATVVIPGPPGKPVLVTVWPHGEGGWFLVDRTGKGAHPATVAANALSKDDRAPARALGKALRGVQSALGMGTDPAILDVLFGAQVPTLTRLAVALRAGRAMSGGRGEPVTRFLVGSTVDRDPLPSDPPEDLLAATSPEALSWILDGLSHAVRDHAEEAVRTAHELAKDTPQVAVLMYHLAELASHLVQLPAHSILPPLGAAEDSVAVGLKAALRAEGDGDANRELQLTYRFLGGRYVNDAPHAYQVTDTPPPDGWIERWSWFGSEVRKGRKQADALWPEIVDPAS
ncbi:MAG: hypothetical protein KC656_24180 [Myxococcales bacterium]|nr:hypothetical protein [Myxococcales bacterium]MCB9669305.1 hypothetical protein [Alphaproteobacteria bacterium]MCB9690429.1 hypothetical protein [Alphaproteobacteria bacterium]